MQSQAVLLANFPHIPTTSASFTSPFKGISLMKQSSKTNTCSHTMRQSNALHHFTASGQSNPTHAVADANQSHALNQLIASEPSQCDSTAQHSSRTQCLRMRPPTHLGLRLLQLRDPHLCHTPRCLRGPRCRQLQQRDIPIWPVQPLLHPPPLGSTVQQPLTDNHLHLVLQGIPASRRCDAHDTQM